LKLDRPFDGSGATLVDVVSADVPDRDFDPEAALEHLELAEILSGVTEEAIAAMTLDELARWRVVLARAGWRPSTQGRPT
jgi:hypothetical protein